MNMICSLQLIRIAETMDGFVASILSASIPLLARRPPVGCRRIQDVYKYAGLRRCAPRNDMR